MADLIRNFDKFLSERSENGDPPQRSEIRNDLCLIANLRNICKNNDRSLIFGRTLEDEHSIWQWVEYYQLNIGQNAKPAFSVLQDLNQHLGNNSFLTGCEFTAADYVIYHGLHSPFAKLSAEERERFANVCRWLDLVQHQPFVRQQRQLLHFSKTPLYAQRK